MPNRFKKFVHRLLQKTQTKKQVTAFHEIWKKHKMRIGKSEEKVIQDVISDVRDKISNHGLSPEQIVQDAIVFIVQTDSPLHQKRNKQILLVLVDILASYNVQNRSLVRHTLSMLYAISKCMDREILFFEQAEQTKPVKVDELLLSKQLYMLEQTAGWMVQGEDWGSTAESAYLELPFRRASSTANSNIMAEALYRQQDPDFVLRLLQHGLQPSCLYLWPTCILIDLKFTLTDNKPPTPEDIMESNEAVMVRYFCRARHFIHVHAVRTEERGESMANLPSGVGYDDILLVPPKAIGIIPESRYKFPSRLQHQCRLRIRRALHDADNLPRGIDTLPLPTALKHYLHLRMD